MPTWSLRVTIWVRPVESNPALAENGVVMHHAGIRGGADLDPAVHGWSGPVVKVTISSIG